MTHDLYTRLAEGPFDPGPSASGSRGEAQGARRFPPSTVYTASIETIDNDYLGSLLHLIGP